MSNDMNWLSAFSSIKLYQKDIGQINVSYCNAALFEFRYMDMLQDPISKSTILLLSLLTAIHMKASFPLSSGLFLYRCIIHLSSIWKYL